MAVRIVRSRKCACVFERGKGKRAGFTKKVGGFWSFGVVALIVKTQRVWEMKTRDKGQGLRLEYA